MKFKEESILNEPNTDDLLKEDDDENLIEDFHKDVEGVQSVKEEPDKPISSPSR